VRKDGENNTCDVTRKKHSVTNVSGEQIPESPMDKEPESSDILKRYLQSLQVCARKKRRRCISEDLGK
jgi:hypothetical protein